MASISAVYRVSVNRTEGFPRFVLILASAYDSLSLTLARAQLSPMRVFYAYVEIWWWSNIWLSWEARIGELWHRRRQVFQFQCLSSDSQWRDPSYVVSLLFVIITGQKFSSIANKRLKIMLFVSNTELLKC